MKNNKNVFFLLLELNVSGVSSHCRDLAIELVSRKYNVIFICGNISNHETAGLLIQNGIEIHEIGFQKKQSFKNFLIFLLSCFKFIKLLYRYKPSIIHCHYRSTAPFAAIAKLFIKTKTLLTIHLHNMPRKKGIDYFTSKLDSFIAISTDIENSLLDGGIERNKITKIFNGVDTKVFKVLCSNDKKQLRLKYRLKQDKLTLVLVARMIELKSIDTLIEAVAALKEDDRSQIQCIMVGDGSHLQRLKTLTSSLGVESTITFTGFQRPHDYYALSDIFVLPSKQEGFSVAVVEAMLSGLAILKTPTSGTGDQLIDGHNGFVFPFFDHLALAEKINFLLHNPNTLKTMQENSYQMAASKFTLRIMGQNVADVYKELIIPNPASVVTAD